MGSCFRERIRSAVSSLEPRTEEGRSPKEVPLEAITEKSMPMRTIGLGMMGSVSSRMLCMDPFTILDSNRD